jgi:hypothetical protein
MKLFCVYLIGTCGSSFLFRGDSLQLLRLLKHSHQLGGEVLVLKVDGSPV